MHALLDAEVHVAAAQHRAAAAYGDPDGWSRMAVLNVARTPTFSSDRTIRQYADEIWGLKAVPPAEG